jgi:DNA-directed RNA polymerase specialized sigma24 family protein
VPELRADVWNLALTQQVCFPTVKTFMPRVYKENSPHEDDPELLPFLTATDEMSENLALERLLQSIIPNIEVYLRHIDLRSLQRRLVWSEDDAKQEICLKIIRRLRHRKRSPDSPPISDFRSYVAITTRNFCLYLLSQKYLQRKRLIQNIREIFKFCPEFARWTGRRSIIVCGFSIWKRREDFVETLDIVQLPQSIEEELRAINYPTLSIAELPLKELIGCIFRVAGAPLPIKELIRCVSEIQNVQGTEFREIGFDELFATSADAAPYNPTQSMELRQLLKLLMPELRLLRKDQRVALLLGLKDADGQSALSLFNLTGIASDEEIAQLLGVDFLELKRIQDGSRLKDAEISAYLEDRGKSVSNLRDAARKRLERKLKKIIKRGKNSGA